MDINSWSMKWRLVLRGSGQGLVEGGLLGGLFALVAVRASTQVGMTV